MTELGRNPACIIPAWQTFLDECSGYGRPARGIGEPIWVGRRPEEIAECQLHESLLNLAIDPDLPFWLVCPYDDEQLDRGGDCRGRPEPPCPGDEDVVQRQSQLPRPCARARAVHRGAAGPHRVPS